MNLKDHPLSHPGPCWALLDPPTYLHPLLLMCWESCGFIVGSLCSGWPVSRVGPYSNPISEESVETWIQASSVSQPVRCEMPHCMFCCRQRRRCVWIIAAPEPPQHCLTVGSGGCKNSSLNSWILPGLLGEGLTLETFACIGTFCT